MGNKNKKNTIKDLFYPILGTFVISLSIYLFTFTTGDDYSKPSPAFISENHTLIDRKIVEKEYVQWDKKVMEAPEVELVHLSEKKEEESKNKSNESNWMNFISTAYVSDCPGCTGYTYWKEWDVRNTIYSPQGYRVVASDPNIIPMGSLVKIRYGDTEFTARVMDIGSAIQNRKIDLLVNSESEAFQWGVKNIEIKIIEWGEG